MCEATKLNFLKCALSSCTLLMKSDLCNNHSSRGFSSSFTYKTKTTLHWLTLQTLLNMLKRPNLHWSLFSPCVAWKHVSVCTSRTWSAWTWSASTAACCWCFGVCRAVISMLIYLCTYSRNRFDYMRY